MQEVSTGESKGLYSNGKGRLLLISAYLLQRAIALKQNIGIL